MTQGIAMSARGDLEDHWRWQYDILVYPKEAQEYQGLGDGWGAPQTSIASYGGISLEDLQAMQQIPGFEVVTPLSILGYVDYEGISTTFDQAENGNIYQIQYQQKKFMMIKSIEYVKFTFEGQISGREQESIIREDGFSISKQSVPPTRTIRYSNQMFLVAIDPSRKIFFIV